MGSIAGEGAIRAVERSDAPALQAFHRRLSSRSVFLRHLGAKDALTDEEARWLVGVDHGDREAFVVVIGAEIIGIGRYDALAWSHGNERIAEVAFVVLDDHQGQGWGSRLLSAIVAVARDRGFTALVAEVLPGNGRMIAVFEHCGLPCRMEHDIGTVHVTLDLTDGTGLGFHEPAAPRARVHEIPRTCCAGQ